jgi:hypothetical protein
MSSLFEHKKKIGRPKVDSELLRARMERALIDRLDAWIASQPDPKPSRPEAIRRLVEKVLEKPADAGSIPAEDLNASNDE